MKAWRPHLVLLAVAVAMVVVARVRHVSTAEARAVALDAAADPDERVPAILITACRATEVDDVIGTDLASALLASAEERLLESALLVHVCRHANKKVGDRPPLQERAVFMSLDPEAWTPSLFRRLILYRYKVGASHVGGVRRLVLAEVLWFIATLRNDPLPPSSEITAHFQARERERELFGARPPTNK